MSNKNYILLFMLSLYILLVCYIYYNYNCNSCVSNIICNDNCKYIILTFIILIGIGSICYEIERKDTISLCLIILLVLSIIGLIVINEENMVHYVFASIVFIIILLFMLRHILLQKYNKILLLSFITNIIIFVYLLINIYNNIFCAEVFYILNFALFYLYLHLQGNF
jgi:hypothetical protein